MIYKVLLTYGNMPTKHSIMIDLEDPKTDVIAEAISNKTAKKILFLLAEAELTESEIAEKLGVPLNTVDYTIKKLEHVGFIEKAKTFSWSPKGKAVYRYRISNKRIIISPRSMVRGVIPAVLISGLLALGIKIFFDAQQIPIALESGAKSMEAITAPVADSAIAMAQPSLLISLQADPWIWFFGGALAAVIIFVIWNVWRKGK